MNVAAFLRILLVWSVAGIACAHPLGDNSVNRLAAIEVNQDRIDVRYLLEMAEIPTLFAGQTADVNQDDVTSDLEWRAFSRNQAAQLLPQLQLTLAGAPLALHLGQTHWQIKPGNADLSVLKLTYHFSALIPPGARITDLTYADSAAPDQPGWKGVTLKAGQGVELVSSNVGQDDPTRGLTLFPTIQGALLDQTSAQASLTFAPVNASSNTNADMEKPIAVEQSFSNRVDTHTASKAEEVPEAETIGNEGPLPQEHGSNLSSFFFLGIHHIAVGWDHLAFLLGLFLLSPATRALVKVVSAFTVAHSITLTLAAMGWIYVPGAWVEPAIAATVAYAGWLSFARRKASQAVAMAFGFGLIHGLGFAGAFAETLGQTSLASAQLLDLLSFNVGIEAFQLALIGMAVPIRSWLTGHSWSFAAHRYTALGVMSFGSIWLISRTLGEWV